MISQSVPHIYLSGLPFSPRGIGVSEQYLALYPQTFGIRQGGQSGWPAIQSILYGHTHYVRSVAFSPDGRRIVSASDDKSVRVWDAETGQTVLGPLEGHTSPVSSVSFSPDGRHIVSGSHDQSVQVWDTETGRIALGPLGGHP
jgi:WD40 repeat protein